MSATALLLAERRVAAGGAGIAFRSLTNTSYGSATNTVLSAPAGLANGDILVALIVTATGGTPPTPTGPAGFAAFGTATVVNDGSFQGRFSIFWKRASSESGSYTFTHSTCSAQGVLKAYSGCLASGTPLGATANATTADGGAVSQTTVGPSITTTAANSFLLFETHNWTASGTLSPPSGMTERFDNLIYSADQLIAAAGATGTRTQTNGNVPSSAEQWSARMVELLSA